MEKPRSLFFQWTGIKNFSISTVRITTSSAKMNNIHIKSAIAWTVAVLFGLVITISWLLILLRGDVSGMAAMVIVPFVSFYILGYFVIMLPFFLIFWHRNTKWIWQFRYMLPLGFFAAGTATVFIKGVPISESYVMEMAVKIGVYGCLIACVHPIVFKLANRVGGRF